MVVESVRPASSTGTFHRVKLWVIASLAVLTVVMVALWPYQEAHRSVASFVVTLLWTLAALTLSSMIIAGPDADPAAEASSAGSS